MFLHYPLLSRSGHGCGLNDAIFMSWSGLRGALGITLALVVESEREQLGLSSRDANRFFFYVGGLATLTLLINGVFAAPMLSLLGLVGEKSATKDLVT